MTITPTTLSRAAGLAAVAGGLLFIAVQFNHPLLTAPFTTTTEYTVRETAKIFMALLSLIGITGIYLRQVRQTGVLGLIGYLFSASATSPSSASRSSRCSSCRTLRPASLATSTTPSPSPPAAPRSATSTGCKPSQRPLRLHRRRRHLRHRALPRRVLARWAAALMSLAAVATVATYVLPELVQRLFAIPASVALIGLGYSLWRDQRTQAYPSRPARSPSSTRPRHDDHHPVHRPSRSGGGDRLGAVRAGRPGPAPPLLRRAAPGRAGRRSP